MSGPPTRTLWEEGRLPGGQVAVAAAGAALLVTLVDVAITDELSLFFDLTFVAACVSAALAVRPRDFFAVGVLPPLLMLGTILIVALLFTGAVAEPQDGLIQAIVSGLAHHAKALVIGYGLTLAVLALRHVVTSSPDGRRTSPDRRNRSVSPG